MLLKIYLCHQYKFLECNIFMQVSYIYLDTKNEGPEFKSFDDYLKSSVDFLISFEKEFKNKIKEDLKK